MLFKISLKALHTYQISFVHISTNASSRTYCYPAIHHILMMTYLKKRGTMNWGYFAYFLQFHYFQICLISKNVCYVQFKITYKI